ncbi:ABC transporter ATP-binding protein [candidate division KSB1 bacterium]|nr:ABC transporter ATP-binding protein [candidate division KSB1 bacterium]
MANNSVVQVNNLRKTYGSLVAVDGISFEVYEGEIFGMVGPNGAGKTTTIECIEGLRSPNDGEINVLGLNPTKDGYKLKTQIGIQLQQAELQARIKVWEALDLYSSFYGNSINLADLLERLGLSEKRNTHYSKLSGGQKQRLFIAMALLNNPELIFLDELTTGLDPQARHNMWDLVRGIRDDGKTVFLTTHFMEEAERLCDRVAIMDNGKIIAIDTPGNLVKNLGAENRVVFMVDEEFDTGFIEEKSSVTKLEQSGNRMVVYGKSDQLVVDVVVALSEKKIQFRDLRTEQPNLEDVFLSLTGHSMRD